MAEKTSIPIGEQVRRFSQDVIAGNGYRTSFVENQFDDLRGVTVSGLTAVRSKREGLGTAGITLQTSKKVLAIYFASIGSPFAIRLDEVKSDGSERETKLEVIPCYAEEGRITIPRSLKVVKSLKDVPVGGGKSSGKLSCSYRPDGTWKDAEISLFDKQQKREISGRFGNLLKVNFDVLTVGALDAPLTVVSPFGSFQDRAYLRVARKYGVNTPTARAELHYFLEESPENPLLAEIPLQLERVEDLILWIRSAVDEALTARKK